MNQMIVLTISVFFLLSLSGAYILFRFLKSSAVVKTRRYRAGGAVGGFLIIYGMLFGSYYQIAKQGPTITGTVDPSLQGAKIVLAVSAIQPDSAGHFKLITPFNMNLQKDGASLYVIAPPGERFVDNDDSVSFYDLESNGDLAHLKLSARLKQPESEAANQPGRRP